MALLEDDIIKLEYHVPLDSKSLKEYGQFLLKVVHNYAEGDKVLFKLKNTVFMEKKVDYFSREIKHDHDLGDVSTPIIILDSKKENGFIISNINMVAALTFGYSKNELINKNINLLVPDEIAHLHDGFIKDYLKGEECRIINKDRFILAKHKTQYLIPLQIYVKVVESHTLQT